MSRNDTIPRRTEAGVGGWIVDDYFFETDGGVYEKGAELIWLDSGKWNIRFCYYDKEANKFGQYALMFYPEDAKKLFEEIKNRRWLDNPDKYKDIIPRE